MSLYIVVIHAIILVVSLLCFSPFRSNADYMEYNELFKQSAPKFYKVYFFFIFFLAFYGFAYSKFFYINYIDTFDNIICYMLIFIFGAVIFFIMYEIFKDEILYPTDEFKKKRKYLVKSMILYLYAFSILGSCCFIFTTNSLLDFRSKEELIVTIGDKNYEHSGSGGNSTYHYELFITPTINGINPIEASSSFYEKVKKGDKIKLYVCKGLYGQRYFSNKMELLN